MRQLSRNPGPDPLTLVLVGVGLYVWWRSRQRSAPTWFGATTPAGFTGPPPSYSGWPAIAPQMAIDGGPCTTTNGLPGTWRRVPFGAVQIGGIPQQWVCWSNGVPYP